MRNVLIKIEGVELTYKLERGGKIQALQNINLEIYEKEIISILGPSGCGKTSLLFIIAGLISPSEGKVTLNGTKICGPSAERGVIFQEDAIFPWMRVIDNIEYGLKLRRISKRERQSITQRYIDLVRLKGFEHVFPKELSGGMRKRVDMARVFANDPSIVLMDEPFGSLDVQTKEKLQVELSEICQREKKTVVFVTHDLEESIFMGDRIVVMGKQPGYIKNIIEISFPRLRKLSIKTTSEFQSLRKKLWELMSY